MVRVKEIFDIAPNCATAEQQQQGSRHHQTLLWGKIVRHAVESPDPQPEPSIRGYCREHRQATRDHHRPEDRISRILHLKPEEPKLREAKQFDHYMLFANRRLTSNAEAEIRDLIATQCGIHQSSIYLCGLV
jgi:hypothetical protein